AFDPAVVQSLHALPKRLDPRLLVRRALGGRRLEQRGQGGWLRQGRVEEPLVCGPLPVPGDGVPAHAEVPGDAPVRLTQLETPQDLANVGPRTPPSRHPHLREQEVDPCPRSGGVGRASKKSGHVPPGGSTWPPLGGSLWVTLPGSVWA